MLVLGDLDLERARTQAEKHDVPTWGDAQDVLDHPGVQVVVNLTVPAVHAEISSAAIAAGKHVWTEKPLGLDRESTSALLTAADEAGLRVGCAPDTVLGPGVQTAKREIAKGTIGRPLFAQTSMQWQGPEVFHPNPGFLFAKGAGPLLDIGPYYFTTLVSLFGTVEKVAAVGLKATEERAIQVGPKAGDTFPVEVPSTISVLTQFEGGQTGQLAGQLRLAARPSGHRGDPRHRGVAGGARSEHVRGAHRLREAASSPSERSPPEQEWIEVPQEGVVAGRGTGLLDMVRAIAEDRPACRQRRGGLSRARRDALGRGVRRLRRVRQPSTAPSPRCPLVPEDFDPFASTL